MKDKVSRRDFIKVVFTGVGAFLASCLPRNQQTSDPTSTPTVTNTSTDTPSPTSTSTPTATPTETLTPTPTEIPCFSLLTPENEAKLKALGKVTFSWGAMQGAFNYKLEIILPSRQSIFFETDQTSKDFYLEVLQLGGEYQWQVTAFDENGTILCTAGLFIFEKPAYNPPEPTKEKGGNNDGSGGVTVGETTGNGE